MRIVPILVLGLAACSPAANKWCSMATTQSQSLLLTGGAVATDGRAISAELLASAVAGVVGAGTSPGPVHRERTEAEDLAALMETIDFARQDVAIVRSGRGRGVYSGQVTTSPGQVTLVFSTGCSPCGGGDPGSYESAAAGYELTVRPSTTVVAVEKGAHVSTQTCQVSCRPCGRNIP